MKCLRRRRSPPAGLNADAAEPHQELDPEDREAHRPREGREAHHRGVVPVVHVKVPQGQSVKRT